MALKNRSDVKVTYAKIKDGKFYLSTDKENKVPFDSLEGVITDIFLKEETYEGKPIKKLYVAVTDGDEKTLIGFSFDSSYTTSLVGFLVNADLSKKLELSPSEKTVTKNDVEVKERKIFVSQDGKNMSSHFTKLNPNGLPAMKKIKFNGKDVWDKTEFLEFFEKTINEVLKPRLTGSVSTPTVPQEDNAGGLPWDDNTTVPDDLPF